jgi:NitT/TauT family transport system substrate-binding protein
MALIGCGTEKPETKQPTTESEKVFRIRLQHQWVLDAALAGIYYASEQGFYRDAGLEVELIPGGSGIDPIHSVISGQALIGIHTNAASVIIPKSTGIPLRVIASQYQKAPLGFLAKASSGIEKVEDLGDKRIGSVQSSLSTVEAVLKLNGLEGQSEVVVISPANSFQVLLDDQIDVLVAFKGNQGVRLELDGIPIVFFNFADIGYRQEGYPFFVTQQALEENRDVLVRFLAETKRGWEYVLQHPEEGAQLTVEKYQEGGTYEAALGLVKTNAELMQSQVTEEHGLFYMDRDSWEATDQILLDTNLISEPTDLDELLTWELLEAT